MNSFFSSSSLLIHGTSESEWIRSERKVVNFTGELKETP